MEKCVSADMEPSTSTFPRYLGKGLNYMGKLVTELGCAVITKNVPSYNLELHDV